MRVSPGKRQSQDNLKAHQAPVLSSTFLSSYQEKSVHHGALDKQASPALSHSNSLRAAVTTASMLSSNPLVTMLSRVGVTGQGKSQKATPDCW